MNEIKNFKAQLHVMLKKLFFFTNYAKIKYWVKF